MRILFLLFCCLAAAIVFLPSFFLYFSVFYFFLQRFCPEKYFSCYPQSTPDHLLQAQKKACHPAYHKSAGCLPVQKHAQTDARQQKSSDPSFVAPKDQIADRHSRRNPVKEVFQIYRADRMGDYFSKDNQKVVEKPEYPSCRHRLQKEDRLLADCLADRHLFKQPSQQRIALFSVSSL